MEKFKLAIVKDVTADNFVEQLGITPERHIELVKDLQINLIKFNGSAIDALDESMKGAVHINEVVLLSLVLGQYMHEEGFRRAARNMFGELRDEIGGENG